MTRNFKLIEPNTPSTYTGKTPKQAAQKAFTQLRKKNNSNKKIKFSIKETTQDSAKKVYMYEGSRNKLDTPQIVQYGSGKNVKKVEYLHKDIIYRIYE